MKNKLSHSSVSKYNTCPKSYDLHYNQRIRPRKVGSALLFGKALDSGFNALLLGRSLAEAQDVFNYNWNETDINGEKITLYNSDLIKYSKNDLDEELLLYNTYEGFPNKSWMSLKCKGLLMLESYEKNFLPLVKKVVAVQKSINYKNSEGDEITGNIDLIVEFHDGTVYLLDNKSSSVKFTDESPRESQQLVLYYYYEKDITKLNGIGFAVLNKRINKNRTKVCSQCNFDGSKNQFKTCNNEYEKKNLYDLSAPGIFGRCHGKWIETIKPTADFTLILNTVTSEDEERVINDFDKANENIKKGEFKENYDSCIGKYGKCDYFSFCHENNGNDYIQLEKKNE